MEDWQDEQFLYHNLNSHDIEMLITEIFPSLEEMEENNKLDFFNY